MATGPVVRDSLRTAPVGTARSRPSQISRVPYLPGLDGMRALAVVAVMIYHANSSWLPGGFLGVEVFFVISGYLITLLLIAERERNGRVDLGHFWMRRAKRLLPALFVMLFIIVTYAALFRSDTLGQIRGDVVSSLFYVVNWYQIWVGQGYSASGDFAPLRHLWSLAVEEQFYLVWPLVMAALLKVGPRKVTAAAKWLVLAAVLVTLFMAVAYHPGRVADCETTPEAYWTIGERCISKADTLYLSTVTRSGGLLLGAAFAMVWRPAAIMRSPMRSKGLLVDLLAVVGLVGLGAMTWYVNFMTPDGADALLFRGGFFVASLLTLFVIAAVTHQRAYAGKVLGNPLFLWVGTRSYGLYLYHWPIYQMIREVAGVPLTAVEFAVAMVFTVAITEASYRYIETPIRTGQIAHWWRGLRRSKDPLPRQIVLAGAASCIALGLFSSVSLATATVQQNEIEASLDAGRGSTTDISELIGGGGGDGDGGDGGGSGDVDDGSAAPAPDTDAAIPNGTTPTTVPLETVPGGTVAPTTTTTTTTTTTLPPEPITYLAVGDSVMQGAAPTLASAGVVVDARESRQLVDMIEPLRQLQANDLLGRAVIVHLGTNGPVSEASLNQLMDTLSGVEYVLVLTVRCGYCSWTDDNNALLRSLSEPGPNYRNNVIRVDWQTVSNNCVDNCIASDGVHLRPNGQRFYAQQIFDILGLSPG